MKFLKVLYKEIAALLCLKRGSNFCQVTIVSLFLWTFSSIMIITHHSWYMALFIFRTFEAFYQIIHTSLGGIAAYNFLDTTPYFWKVSWGFIYWVINDRNRTSLFIIISKRTQSFVQDLKVIAYNNPQGKGVIVSHIAFLWGIQCFLTVPFIFLLCTHIMLSCCHQTSSMVSEYYTPRS